MIAEYEKITDYCTEMHQEGVYIIGFKDGMQLQQFLDRIDK